MRSGLWSGLIFFFAVSAVPASALRYGQTFYAVETKPNSAQTQSSSNDDGWRMEVGHKYKCAFNYCLTPWGPCWNNFNTYHKYEIYNNYISNGVGEQIYQKGMFLDDDIVCNYYEEETYGFFKAHGTKSWYPKHVAVRAWGHYYQEMSNELRLEGIGGWDIATDKDYDEIYLSYKAWPKTWEVKLKKGGTTKWTLTQLDFIFSTNIERDSDCAWDADDNEWCYREVFTKYSVPYAHRTPVGWPSSAAVYVIWHRELYCKYNAKSSSNQMNVCEHDEPDSTISGHYSGTYCYDGHRQCPGTGNTATGVSWTGICTCENYTNRRRKASADKPKIQVHASSPGNGDHGVKRVLHGGAGGGRDDVAAVTAGVLADDPEWSSQGPAPSGVPFTAVLGSTLSAALVVAIVAAVIRAKRGRAHSGDHDVVFTKTKPEAVADTFPHDPVPAEAGVTGGAGATVQGGDSSA